VAAAPPLYEQLRRQDRGRFLTALFAPQPARDELIALYAFAAEIARVPYLVKEPGLGAIRLQWWRDGLDGVAAGMPPQHPVLEALGQAQRRKPWRFDLLRCALDARERELDPTPLANLAACESHAREAAATVVLAALDRLGTERSADIEVGQAVGIAVGLAELAGGRLAPPLAVEAAARSRELTAEARARRSEISRRSLPALLAARLTEARRDRRPDGLLAARLIWANWTGRY